MKKTLIALLRMSRPYYVIQAIVPPIAGYLGTSHSHFSFLTLVTIASVASLLAMAAWAANEVSDKEQDIRGHSKEFHGLYVSGGTGVLFVQKLPIWIVITYTLVLGLTALGLAATINVTFFVLTIVSGLISFFYSLPPIRLKTRGIIGALLTSSSYGLLAFIAGCVASGGEISIVTLSFGMVMSMAVFGYDGLGHIIDYVDDKANGLNTFAVQLGLPRATKLLAIFQILPAIVLWGLQFAGLLHFNLISLTLMSSITAITAIFVLLGRNEHSLSALRIMSVPILSGFFFLFI